MDNHEMDNLALAALREAAGAERERSVAALRGTGPALHTALDMLGLDFLAPDLLASERALAHARETGELPAFSFLPPEREDRKRPRNPDKLNR